VKVAGLPSGTPDTADTPALIIRRQQMDAGERFLVRPFLDNPKGLDRNCRSSTFVQGDGAVAVPRKMLEQKDSKPVYTLAAIVGRSIQTTRMSDAEGTWSEVPTVGSANPLLIYKLVPPGKFATSVYDSTSTKLTWEYPEFAKTSPLIVPKDVLAGYRVFGKDRNGKIVALADIVFNNSSTGKTSNVIVVAPNSAQATLSNKVIGDYNPIGIASVDAMVKDPKTNELAVSEIAWLDAQGIVEGTHAVPAGTYNPNSNNPFEMGGESKPVPNATVTLVYVVAPRNPVTLTTTTDDQGRFTFKSVPGGSEFTITAGKYSVKGSMPVPPQRLSVFVGDSDPGKEIKILQTVPTGK